VVGDALTLTEVAEMLRLRTKTVADYARRRELAGRRIGRRWLFAQEAFAPSWKGCRSGSSSVSHED